MGLGGGSQFLYVFRHRGRPGLFFWCPAPTVGRCVSREPRKSFPDRVTAEWNVPLCRYTIQPYFRMYRPPWKLQEICTKRNLTFKVDKNPHFIPHNLYIVLLQDLLLVD